MHEYTIPVIMQFSSFSVIGRFSCIRTDLFITTVRSLDPSDAQSTVLSVFIVYLRSCWRLCMRVQPNREEWCKKD